MDNQFLGVTRPIPAPMIRPIIRASTQTSARSVYRRHVKYVQRTRFVDIVVNSRRPSLPIDHKTVNTFSPVVDQLLPTHTAAAPASLLETSPLPPIQRQFAAVAQPAKSQSRLRELLGYIAIVVVAVGVGSVITFSHYSQWLIAVYAVAVLIFRLKSQISFFIALLFLTSVPVLLLIGHQSLANDYATYSFLLLVIGVVSATLELRTTTN